MSEGAATTRGEVEKDIHEAAVEQAGGIFIPFSSGHSGPQPV